MTDRIRRLIRVEGIVQGVGFRPFVHRVATELDLVGQVSNDAAGVVIDVEGSPDSMYALLAALHDRPPPLARIDVVHTAELACNGAQRFEIAASDAGAPPATLVAPDVATCDDCVRELFDPADRRYLYPFVNCTNCGPRFTIVCGIPYDRAATTMAGFAMCADCRREYDDVTDRRFHAQPVCCPACGPQLVWHGPGQGEPLGEAVRALRAGAVVAVKGLGGYHLAALASDAEAVGQLRSRKHREEKPFAVLCADLEQADRLAVVDEAAARALTLPERPIVILPRRADAVLGEAVAPRTGQVGVLLPYTPLHHLLARSVGEPLVLTSGNVSDEPIAYDDDDALHRLAGIADAFLTHDRGIRTRVDDSVVRVMRGAVVPVRRSRGYAPAPVRLSFDVDKGLLACGAELKNTFALARGHHAFVSHHIGDLENAETLRSFTDGIDHLGHLFDISPEVVVHDLHPEYLSTKWALEQEGVELIGVQHHHAHIASCLTDNGESGPAIGVAFDGLGFGIDATMWGGEILLADLAGFDRLGHLQPVPMPGGAQAVRQPWRMAVAWLDEVYGDDVPSDLDVVRRHEQAWPAMLSLARSALSVRTSSVGRLFDAVAAICGVRDEVAFEGQAAIELEQMARRDCGRESGDDMHVQELDGGSLVRALVEDLRRGVPGPEVSWRFHRGLAGATAAACAGAREMTGVNTVALSGGVFQNELLLRLLVDDLESRQFRVLTHRQVPPNDGGISLGQVAVGAARVSR